MGGFHLLTTDGPYQGSPREKVTRNKGLSVERVRDGQKELDGRRSLRLFSSMFRGQEKRNETPRGGAPIILPEGTGGVVVGV